MGESERSSHDRTAPKASVSVASAQATPHLASWIRARARSIRRLPLSVSTLDLVLTFQNLPEVTNPWPPTNTTTAAPAPPVQVPPRPGGSGRLFIGWTGVDCLNQHSRPTHGVANALKQIYRDDEGLIYIIPFMQVVKLHSALIKGPEDEGPKTVKLFSNKEHMGFRISLQH